MSILRRMKGSGTSFSAKLRKNCPIPSADSCLVPKGSHGGSNAPRNWCCATECSHFGTPDVRVDAPSILCRRRRAGGQDRIGLSNPLDPWTFDRHGCRQLTRLLRRPFCRSRAGQVSGWNARSTDGYTDALIDAGVWRPGRGTPAPWAGWHIRPHD